MTLHPSAVVLESVEVLNELTAQGGRVTWQARRSQDRGRLEVVAIVQPSEAPTIVHALTEAQLRELLTDAPADGSTRWTCDECGTLNDPGRRWCAVCSGHQAA